MVSRLLPGHRRPPPRLDTSRGSAELSAGDATGVTLALRVECEDPSATLAIRLVGRIAGRSQTSRRQPLPDGRARHLRRRSASGGRAPRRGRPPPPRSAGPFALGWKPAILEGCSLIAQLVERRTVNPQVPGSSPGRGARRIKGLRASAGSPFPFAARRSCRPVMPLPRAWQECAGSSHQPRPRSLLNLDGSRPPPCPPWSSFPDANA
jgi:hypothetical protein